MGIIDTLVKTAAKTTIMKSAESLVETTIIAAAQGYSNVSKQMAENKQQEIYNTLEKKQVTLIKVPRCAEEFIGMKCDDVVAELTAYGFTNIVTLPKKDLFKIQSGSVGKVAQIAANGNDEFKSKAKFVPDTRFVVTYHELRK